MDVGERYGTVKFAGWQQPLEKRAKRSERRKEEEKTGGTDQQLDRWTGTDCRGTSATCGPALTGPADGDPATTCRCLLVPRERPRADTGPPSEIRSSPAKVLPHRVDAASNRRRFPGFFCERVPSTASVDLAGQSGARGNQQMIWREPPTANNAKAMGRDAHRGLTRQPVAWLASTPVILFLGSYFLAGGGWWCSWCICVNSFSLQQFPLAQKRGHQTLGDVEARRPTAIPLPPRINLSTLKTYNNRGDAAGPPSSMTRPLLRCFPSEATTWVAVDEWRPTTALA
ncbi:hypothetical protein GW17_00049340 [Ensete ventricosum]|nr:hypothetical protein GW17_00049340 [Ensete ventricosum]